MVDKIVVLCAKTTHMKMSFFVYFTHKLTFHYDAITLKILLIYFRFQYGSIKYVGCFLYDHINTRNNTCQYNLFYSTHIIYFMLRQVQRHPTFIIEE